MTNDTQSEAQAPPRVTPIESGVHRGLRWAVVAGPVLGVNGYVQLPTGHPWEHLGYDDIDVAVHGGLTYKEDRWIGFDTAHAGDCWASEYDKHGMSRHYGDGWDRDWTVPAVITETHGLIDSVLAGEQS